jgi:hypothetical protein
VDTSYGGREDQAASERAVDFDVRRPGVRHSSIGLLDQNYINGRHLAGGSGFAYTRIPPLKSLYTIESEHVRRLQALIANIKSSLAPAKNGLVNLGSRIVSELNYYFVAVPASLVPKRYTLADGLQTEWPVTVPAFNKVNIEKLKMAAPIALLLFAFILLVSTWPANRSTPVQPATKSHSSSVQNQTSSTKTGGGNSANASKPAAVAKPNQTAAKSAASSPTNQASKGSSGAQTPTSAPSASSTTPPGDGNGSSSGGSVSGGGGSGGGLPAVSLPLPLTVPVPPTDVQAGGKPILSTGGTSITVN